MKRYYIMGGYTFLVYRNFSHAAEIKFGTVNYGNNFSGISGKGPFVDIGVSIERHLSEYFRVILKPSVEFKGFKVTLPDNGFEIKHKSPTLFAQFGVSYNIPELPRCPIKACHIQINHVHGGKEYRSRRHPIYKKQNPKYGENYPKLLKYTGKNKRKLHY